MIKKSFSDAITKNMVILSDDEYDALEQLLKIIKRGGAVPIPLKGDYESLNKRIARLEASEAEHKVEFSVKTWHGVPDRRTGERRISIFNS